jgi:hypothetical protein
MSARLLAALFAAPRQQTHAALPSAAPTARQLPEGAKGAAARGHLLLVALAPHRGASLALQDVVAAALAGERRVYERPFLPAD